LKKKKIKKKENEEEEVEEEEKTLDINCDRSVESLTKKKVLLLETENLTSLRS
jgi:hypothetical protein